MYFERQTFSLSSKILEATQILERDMLRSVVIKKSKVYAIDHKFSISAIIWLFGFA